MLIKNLLALLVYSSVSHANFPANAKPEILNNHQIERLTGAHGQFNSSKTVFKVGVPHPNIATNDSDLALQTVSSASFKKITDRTLVTGDLVLTEDQLIPVTNIALDNGLEVTAIHNQTLWDKQHITLVHIEGVGKTKKLALAIGKVFAQIKSPHNLFNQIAITNMDPNFAGFDHKVLYSLLTKYNDHDV